MITQTLRYQSTIIGQARLLLAVHPTHGPWSFVTTLKLAATISQAVFLSGRYEARDLIEHEGRKAGGVGSKWIERTLAMVAGLTDHRWTMKNLLSYKVFSKAIVLIVHG